MASGEGDVIPGRVPADFFPAFIQSTPDFAIFALDPTGIVSSWNPGAERIKGYKASEIVGKHFGVFYTPGDLADHKPLYVLRRALQEGRYEEEGWRVRKDGTVFWANATVTPVRAADGTLRGFVKITRDLTARKHAEEALRQGEERYRLLVESVKDYAIFILDPTGHIASWNAGAQRLKGYAPSEIIGKHFSIFYMEADRARRHPEEELEIALREGRYEEEGWRVRKDGTTFWASVTITALFDSEKRHVGFAKVTRDLTERKRAEERLRERADSYAELNRELDAFSHSVAHDLRAPVRAMAHLSQTLLDDAGERLNAEDRRTVQAMSATAERMAQLIQDLLDLSFTSRQEPTPTPVDLSKLARRIAQEKRKQHPEREIEFRIQDGLVARADERLMRLALGNLFDNAVKFTQGRPALVEFGKERTPRGDAFYVRDNGVGFEAKRSDQLFKPFSRLHATNEYPGTGIGLTIVQRIVRRHGGEVWAEGAPGQGAVFRFTLDGRDLSPPA